MSLKAGQRIDFVRDDLPPLKSPNTDLIGAWLNSGGELLKEEPHSQTVEDTQSGPKMVTTWLVNGDVKAEFGSEQIDFEEFRKRWLSVEWCRENPEHPISYMRAFRDNMTKLKDWIKTQKPSVLIRRGKRVAVIHPDLPEARKNQILAEL